MSGGVFISYRREDAAGFAGRIYDRLTNVLGRESVFIDVDNIRAGLDFVDVLSERVGRCDALIAIIGRNWLASADKHNLRRLDDLADFVRIEIEAALDRDVPVIPVLVDGAVMPQADDLPDGLKKLARRQGIEISHTRFDADAERLTDALARIEGKKPAAADARLPAPAPKPQGGAARWLLAAAALVLVAGGAGFFYEQRGAREEQSRQEEKAKLTSDILKAVPPPQTTSALNTAAQSQSAALSAAATPPNSANNAAAPTPSAAPDETPTGKIADSAPAKIGKADAPGALTGPQQWMNLEDFRVEAQRQKAAGNYPDKISGRCQNSVPQRSAHWSPRPTGQYFIVNAQPEKDFKSDAADMTAKGFKMTFDSVFQGCEGFMHHITGWMKEG